MPDAPCAVDGCDRVVYSRGLCPMHYQRLRTFGTVGTAEPAHRRSVLYTLEERWLARVNKDGPVPAYAPHLGQCWDWTGAISSGYGTLRNPGGTTKAHRIGYELFVGPIPNGLQIDHLCRRTSCVNPDHLEPVTPKENGRRSENFAAKNARKTACLRGHDLTDPANIKPNTRGARQCRACSNLARMDRYRRLGK